MKHLKHLLVALALILAIPGFSQIQDLASMAQGKIVFSSVLQDSKEELAGYFYIYKQDSETQSETMEYVYLDKNLNKVANGTFSNKLFNKVYSSYYDCTLMGNYIILNKYYFYRTFWTNNIKPLLTTFQTISLKDKTVSDDFKYENGQFVPFNADFDEMKTEYKGIESKCIIHAFSNEVLKGFYIVEDNVKNAYLEKEFTFFNENKEKLWSYTFNPDGTKDSYHTFGFLCSNKNNLYIAVSKWSKQFLTNPELVEYKIVLLDLLTGKEKYQYMFETRDSLYNRNIRAKEINGNLVLTGKYSLNSKLKTIYNNEFLGFYRLELNKEGKEISNHQLSWNDLTGKIEIKNDGRLEKGFRLYPLRYFVFSNGNISILTQKVKTDNYSYLKTSDYAVLHMNADFSLTDLTVLPRENGTTSGLLFSQYIKDDAGAVFFYQKEEKDPETKEKLLMMYINSIIDGKLTQEKIPMASRKKYFIEPSLAKEGYIMLHEYNEKDKYNQIRLERLNY